MILYHGVFFFVMEMMCMLNKSTLLIRQAAVRPLPPLRGDFGGEFESLRSRISVFGWGIHRARYFPEFLSCIKTAPSDTYAAQSSHY